jgi:glutamate formiminotransferase
LPAPLVECVPNFSEGRRAEILEVILLAVHRVPGAVLLDSSSDPDHNRSVVTLAGRPEAVQDAAFAAVEVAARRIDLRAHRGEHPRIGAADVIPFVPLRGIPMPECAGLARAFGRRVGEELGLPVYLYGEAALRPERKLLAAVRKGEYEGLAAAIQTDPARAPDFGPARLGSAGAVAVGARAPLIAFNVYLDTCDLKIARAVARRVRASAGGLPALQALGLMVGGLAQVSMNLTDYAQTPIPRAYEAVRAEAARMGVDVKRSELIGLIPRQAAAGWLPADIRLADFSERRILEYRLQKAGLAE